MDLSVLVDMPVLVTRDHGTGPRGNESFSSRSASCSTARSMRWPKHSFSFNNKDYLILGMCYRLCNLTFYKVFYSICCVSLGHEIQWICQLDKVFHGAFTTLGCCATSSFAGKPDVRLSS